jgi:hypothetical protein
MKLGRKLAWLSNDEWFDGPATVFSASAAAQARSGNALIRAIAVWDRLSMGKKTQPRLDGSSEGLQLI